MQNKTVRLSVHGLSIPSFKNKKRMMRGRLITKPETQQQMEEITLNFIAQLRSSIRIVDAATLTEQHQPCLIALLTHSKDFDDSRQWIPEIHIKAVDCDKGNEGAVIEITRL